MRPARTRPFGLSSNAALALSQVSRRGATLRFASLRAIIRIGRQRTRRLNENGPWVEHVPVRVVGEAVGVARPGREAGAHAGREDRRARVRMQRGMPGQNVDELVLPRVGVAQGRAGSGRQPRQVHAEVGEAEEIAQRALLAAAHARGEGLRVVGGLRPRWHVGRPGGRRILPIRHHALLSVDRGPAARGPAQPRFNPTRRGRASGIGAGGHAPDAWAGPPATRRAKARPPQAAPSPASAAVSRIHRATARTSSLGSASAMTSQ